MAQRIDHEVPEDILFISVIYTQYPQESVSHHAAISMSLTTRMEQPKSSMRIGSPWQECIRSQIATLYTGRRQRVKTE
jgi:hypothetical protein